MGMAKVGQVFYLLSSQLLRNRFFDQIYGQNWFTNILQVKLSFFFSIDEITKFKCLLITSRFIIFRSQKSYLTSELNQHASCSKQAKSRKYCNVFAGQKPIMFQDLLLKNPIFDLVMKF